MINRQAMTRKQKVTLLQDIQKGKVSLKEIGTLSKVQLWSKNRDKPEVMVNLGTGKEISKKKFEELSANKNSNVFHIEVV